MSLLLRLYRAVSYCLHPLIPRLLSGRVKQGKEDPLRHTERLGLYQAPRPKGVLVWIHGVSVGESLSALPVIEMIHQRRPDVQFLLTTATTTSASILAQRLPTYARHAFAPVDTPQAVRAFLSHWQPDLALFIESDIWPNMLQHLAQKPIVHGLISARITQKTAARWLYVKGAIRQILKTYAFILPQDKLSAARIRSMGIKCGKLLNLKLSGEAPKIAAAGLQTLRQQIGQRFILVAASTHYGEDAIITKACEKIIAQNALLILVPRHPIRAGEIALDLSALGFEVARRSSGDEITARTQVYIADTLGEMGTFLSLGQLIIMGGSFLIDIGGHNPLEPARLGKACITGPDISNWQDIFETLIEAGGALKVDGITQLGVCVTQLFEAPKALHAMHVCAKNVAQHETQDLSDLWHHIEPHLKDKHGP